MTPGHLHAAALFLAASISSSAQTPESRNFPGAANSYNVYGPAQYDPAKPACLLVALDGFGGFQANVPDNLIARQEIPVIIAVGISPLPPWSPPVTVPSIGQG